MKYYKLTDKNDCTHDNTKWGENVTHKAWGGGNTLCTKDVIHVYDHPLKAVMFNSIHANFPEYHLWECKVRKVVANDGLKVGVKECTTIRQTEAPKITREQRIRVAIYCSLEVYKERTYVKWANDWLSGKDRSESATESAAGSAWSAAKSVESAAWSAESAAGSAWSAAKSVESAARSAESAAWSAWSAAKSVESAARSAESAAWSAESAAWSAWSAAKSVAKSINFTKLIKKTIRDERKFNET